MRFAISAMAAVSGVVLLGLAFYGQPALYLQEAEQQWASLTGDPAANQPVEPDSDDAVANRMTQLQRQVAQLKQELAAVPVRAAAPTEARTAAPAPAQPAQVALHAEPAEVRATASTAGPAASATEPSQTFAAPLLADPSQRAATGGNERTPQPFQEDPTTGNPSKPEAPRIEPPKVEQRRAAARPPKPETARPAPPRPELSNPVSKAAPPKPEVATADAARPEAPVPGGSFPDIRKADSVPMDTVEPEMPTPPLPQREMAAPGPIRNDPVGHEPVKAEAPRPAPQKLAAVRAAPPPPPAPQPEPTRRETDDAQSVLSRLRQFDTLPARQPAPSAEARIGPLVSPVLPRLAAARNALADGRIEDARRLLQETQLQLVFRPIDAAGDDSPRAGRSAADVAHSLEALSANNIPLSRRYIDKAADDLSEKGGGVPLQEPDMRKTGYAPAYPPR